MDGGTFQCFYGSSRQRLLDLKSNGTPADGCTGLADPRDLCDVHNGCAGPLSPRGFEFNDDASARRVRVLSLTTIRRPAEYNVAGLVNARSETPYTGPSDLLSLPWAPTLPAGLFEWGRQV